LRLVEAYFAFEDILSVVSAWPLDDMLRLLKGSDVKSAEKKLAACGLMGWIQ
jgi:hypothetical protein